MRYQNDDLILPSVMDDEKFKGYDYECDYYDKDINECPVCGALYPGYFYVNDDEECVGCEMCVTRITELF